VPYLHPASHAFNVITFLVILTGLASGQGMALCKPSSPYVEAVLVMGLSTIAPCVYDLWFSRLGDSCQAQLIGSLIDDVG
jgi:hypothetical protein